MKSYPIWEANALGLFIIERHRQNFMKIYRWMLGKKWDLPLVSNSVHIYINLSSGVSLISEFPQRLALRGLRGMRIKEGKSTWWNVGFRAAKPRRWLMDINKGILISVLASGDTSRREDYRASQWFIAIGSLIVQFLEDGSNNIPQFHAFNSGTFVISHRNIYSNLTT
jgi:hypothetical protein